MQLETLAPRQACRTWHLLQLSAALDEELACALSEYVPVLGWKPEARWLAGWIDLPKKPAVRRTPTFHIQHFGRMPGYARPHLSALARLGPSVCRRIASHATDAQRDVLVCTTPFLAPVAERWQGPVVYWLTDRIADYTSAGRIDVRGLDRRLCRRADLVCPNSDRLRDYLVEDAGCDTAKIQVLPNGVRAAHLLPAPLLQARELPQAASHRKRPVAGVLGNMGSNVNWLLLLQAVQRTPWLTWLFVGPVGNDVDDPEHLHARQEVQYCRNACFVGAKPYGDLVHYARAIDVAVLPYFQREPTFSGSSTRFYEHLASCRPIIATRGFAELLRKEPLVRLVSDANDLVAALQVLRASGFCDGHEALRWKESYRNTWQVRAQTMQTALERRLPAVPER
ncbi:glycosyltransferase [Terriglobus aquaticus]|uniref:Glycosyltransferase n=1 Tax=Terriglobus aquaticus TaxID=940139 RepID=A0ABW9KGF7_9BACT|nr:glycosyltransferase [Terriglobus aquaticus]